MGRSRVWRWMRVAALAAVVSVAFGSVAFGWDDDDYRYGHDEAREQGSRNGYRDGSRAGQYDRERGARFHFKNDQWEDAHGYQHWMGSHGHYKEAYRSAYEDAYRRAYGNGYRRDWDGDRDGYRHYDRDDWRQ